ncbi:MAG: Rpn family recombination-promoting nuclease/putative transposase [Coleofasciculus sp. D1-CHI-01]|uniref:Rpn family recombination-promoting nuclease/putative transposase n=1 Tax=Coleofasciculus sp. D1-CHI-01 TaxID=3068482 RepID=UPI0032F8DDCA
MRFISPKVDYAFKKIFGSEQSKEILISFLNAIVYDGNPVIKDLTILNPYNPGQILSLKDTYLDVKAVLADGSIVVIEMQIASMAAFNKRVAYNLAKAYANQLVKGEDYPRLNPAMAVTITDFILFQQTEDVINKFVFQEKEKKFEILNQELQLIFVELPKFNKTLSELTSLTDKWIYFLREAAMLEDIPESLGEVSEIKFALNLAQQANMTVEELDIVDRRGMMLQDEKGRIIYAEQKGEQKGESRLILRLLKKRFGEIPVETSSQVENLSIEDLESLGEDFLEFDSLEDLENWLMER